MGVTYQPLAGMLRSFRAKKSSTPINTITQSLIHSIADSILPGLSVQKQV